MGMFKCFLGWLDYRDVSFCKVYRKFIHITPVFFTLINSAVTVLSSYLESLDEMKMLVSSANSRNERFSEELLFRLCKEEKEAVPGCCLEEFRVLFAAWMIHCFQWNMLVPHECGVPLKPYSQSFVNKIEWSTVSNALAKSKNIPHEYRLLSIAHFKLSVISLIACSVEWPFRKLNW